MVVPRVKSTACSFSLPFVFTAVIHSFIHRCGMAVKRICWKIVFYFFTDQMYTVSWKIEFIVVKEPTPVNQSNLMWAKNSARKELINGTIDSKDRQFHNYNRILHHSNNNFTVEVVNHKNHVLATVHHHTYKITPSKGLFSHMYFYV